MENKLFLLQGGVHSCCPVNISGNQSRHSEVNS